MSIFDLKASCLAIVRYFISLCCIKQPYINFPQHSHSWISDDDIYKPYLEEVSDHDELSPSAPFPEDTGPQSPPSVVHRRQIGIPQFCHVLSI